MFEIWKRLHLKRGLEALNSNLALSSCIQRGLERSALPQTAVQVVEKKDREGVSEMLKLSDFIDVVIPRGVRADRAGE